MAKKTETKAPPPTPKTTIYAHVFENDCMNYYGTYSGTTEAELLAQIDNDLRSNEDSPDDFIVLIGPVYKLRAKGIELEPVSGRLEWDVSGIQMR